MGFVNRRKQPAKFRSNPFPTPEQILTGVVVGVAERAIEKAVSYFGRTNKGGRVDKVEHSAQARASDTAAPVTPIKPPRKRKTAAKKKVSKTKE